MKIYTCDCEGGWGGCSANRVYCYTLYVAHQDKLAYENHILFQ